MYEQDYIMRMIHEMVRAIIKLLFGIDTDAPTTELAEMLETENDKKQMDDLMKKIDDGKINEAENLLDEMLSREEGMEGLKKALLFYSYLNEKSDKFLEEHHFTREEVQEGVEALAEQRGLREVIEMFMQN